MVSCKYIHLLTYDLMITIVIHEYKAMLVASAEEKQELEQAIESVKKMGDARDARNLALESKGQIKGMYLPIINPRRMSEGYSTC